jgi:ATP-dependent RNA helicase DeaD
VVITPLDVAGVDGEVALPGSNGHDRAPREPVLTDVAQPDDLAVASQRPVGEPAAFAALGAAEAVLQALWTIGYVEPTPVQAEVIPLMLVGRDVVGQAKTGTGKTAAFGIPLAQMVDPEAWHTQALVLVPTRELAQQVRAELARLSVHTGVHVALVHGGAPMQPEVYALQAGAHVVVGTPGRIMHHIRNGHLKLDQVRFLILDEADEMLDVGFAEDIEWILGHVPHDRQTGLFSATVPYWVQSLIHRYMRDPHEVRAALDRPTVETVVQRACMVAERDKPAALRWLLAQEGKGMRALIFRRRKVDVDWLAYQLERDWPVMALHGDVPQSRRTAIVNKLRSGEHRLVIATNVAARGLDIPDLTHVINYDLPDTPEEYVHRVGRTARAGRTGMAYSFVSEWDMPLFDAIQHFVGGAIDEFALPMYEPAPTT